MKAIRWMVYPVHVYIINHSFKNSINFLCSYFISQVQLHVQCRYLHLIWEHYTHIYIHVLIMHDCWLSKKNREREREREREKLNSVFSSARVQLNHLNNILNIEPLISTVCQLLSSTHIMYNSLCSGKEINENKQSLWLLRNIIFEQLTLNWMLRWYKIF